MSTFRICLFATFVVPVVSAAHVQADEPRVLLLGDSISVGYTPFVKTMLQGQARVLRPMRNAKQAENCAGTNHGVTRIDDWLKIDGGEFDVIHFNWGLHDLKRVDAKTKSNSNDPGDPHQAEPDVYEKQLREIVGKLQATNAKLIFATTTPVPAGKLKPHRDVQDVVKYNDIAKKIMAEHNIAVDDLYSAVLPKLNELQRPVNVHFTPQGSEFLAREVTGSVREALGTKVTK